MHAQVEIIYMYIYTCNLFIIVHACDDSEEKGIYYGINLRGTNFLMIRGSLGGKNLPISELQREEVAIPSTAMDGDSTKVN